MAPDLDGRSTWARRARDIMEDLSAGLGGPEALSEAQRSIVRRCATLTIELERLESSFAAGPPEQSDVSLYNTVAGNLRRLLESLGLERCMSDITPRHGGVVQEDGVRLVRTGFSAADWGVIYGSDREGARRMFFAVRLLIENNEPVPPALAAIVQGLELADIAPDATLPAEPIPAITEEPADVE